ncbi:hypothetical protein [Actinocrispum wychmicini]|uniref:Lipoprotein n=1 Tax=Actinocrispum wychmicini TaxID=1213861 RepID=A0A4R2JBK0_9PSEU|nr:hypothetical protein [Actinocrispum wychmicini]TCO53439.1 hypothetical protein EV192_11028 [Actinocrispum wychmicini]
MPRWGVRSVACAVAAAASLSACSGKSDGLPTGQSEPSVPSTSRPPFTGKTLANGDVQKVTDLGGARMQPVSGAEVRGPGVTLKVVEFGTADQIDDSGSSYRAPDKSTLIAFRTSTTVDKDTQSGVLEQLAFGVSVDGTQRSLPDILSGRPTSGSATASFIVAVPEQRRTVELQLKAAGLTQAIDLLEGKPKGDRPKALYRPAEGTVLRQESLPPANFQTAIWPNQPPAQQVVTVKEADFSYFNGVTHNVPSSPDKAWLTFVGTSATGGNGDICVTPLAAHKLVDDKGATISPSESASKMPGEGYIAEEAFTVSFEVPADVKSVTLVIAPTQMRCQVSTGNYQARQSSGEAKIAVTIPEK